MTPVSCLVSFHGSPAGRFLNPDMKRLIQYLKDTRGELKHVSWPTRRQAIVSSLLVILISLFTAALLGFFDFILTGLLDLIIA